MNRRQTHQWIWLFLAILFFPWNASAVQTVDPIALQQRVTELESELVKVRKDQEEQLKKFEGEDKRWILDTDKRLQEKFELNGKEMADWRKEAGEAVATVKSLGTTASGLFFAVIVAAVAGAWKLWSWAQKLFTKKLEKHLNAEDGLLKKILNEYTTGVDLRKNSKLLVIAKGQGRCEELYNLLSTDLEFKNVVTVDSSNQDISGDGYDLIVFHANDIEDKEIEEIAKSQSMNGKSFFCYSINRKPIDFADYSIKLRSSFANSPATLRHNIIDMLRYTT